MTDQGFNIGLLCEHLHCLPSEIRSHHVTFGDMSFVVSYYNEKGRREKEAIDRNTPPVPRVPR